MDISWFFGLFIFEAEKTIGSCGRNTKMNLNYMRKILEVPIDRSFEKVIIRGFCLLA